MLLERGSVGVDASVNFHLNVLSQLLREDFGALYLGAPHYETSLEDEVHHEILFLREKHFAA